MTNFIEAFTGREICIPLMQREYVQGLNESIIRSFLADLMGDKDIDLNYIYGYDRDGQFVPVDGQQRLTTLWLLHLYCAVSLGRKDFNELHFEGREYAEDFCSKLKENLTKEMTENANLAEEIEAAPWFISSWKRSVTVRAMLKTLGHISRIAKENDQDMEKLWDRLSTNITFSFMELEKDKGLDDDIYIKMNGRGRRLSDFENLKSWIDEKIGKIHYEKGEEWKRKIDNEWANLFWKNRKGCKTGKDKHEDTDEEQLFCFCNLLILHWSKRWASEVKPEETEKISEYIKQQVKEPKDARQELLNLLIDGKLPTLYWLDQLELIDKDFLDFAYESLEKLSKHQDAINKVGDTDFEHYLYLGVEDEVDETTLYNLCMCHSSVERLMPLFYAVIKFCDMGEMFYEKLRIVRNLVLNTDIRSDSLGGILQNIDRIKEADDTLVDIKSFNGEQLEEERRKLVDYNQYRYLIWRMENSHFFRGKIRCMYNFLRTDENYDVMNLYNFRRYSEVLMSIFKRNGESPIEDGLEGEEFILRRAMITFGDHWFGFLEHWWNDGSYRWSFCKSAEQWRNLLASQSSDWAKPEPLRILIRYVLNRIGEAPTTVEAIRNILLKRIEVFTGHYDDELINNISDEDNENEALWYLHFVKWPEVWGYMQEKRMVWVNDRDITLISRTRLSSYYIELRTYTLYLEYIATDGWKELTRKGWTIGTYEREGTCFDMNLYDEKRDKHIAIDAFNCRRRENDYSFQLFLREDQDKDLTDDNYEAKEYFGKMLLGKPIVDSFEWKDKRWLWRFPMSRKDAPDTLTKLLNEITKKVKPEEEKAAESE